uniref:Cholesterol 24-hydroxylase-like n=1 Tax=Sphaeramia orbicularis TaxID=375764 RepID=A0A672ZQD7_9TELE
MSVFPNELLNGALSDQAFGEAFGQKASHIKYDHIPGPPRDSFLLGHSPSFLKVMRNGGIVQDKLLEWSETYGPVYRINIFHFVLIGVTYPLFCGLLSANQIATHFLEFLWRLEVMFLCKTILISRYLRGLMGTFNERAEKLMEKLTEEADKKTEELSMLQLFNGVTLDVIAKVAFDVDLDLQKETSPFPKAIETCLKGMVYYIRDGLFSLNPKNRPFINEVREACRLLRATGAQWIHDRKTAIQNGDDVPKDILTQIIKTAGQDEELMVDNFVTFFIAGQETTANQLAFCVMELGRHPEIMEKVKKEVDDVIGMKMDIRYEDLGQLTYLSQVLKETLRLYSTVPGTSRDILEDMVIDGIRIPGGFTCMLSSYVAGRMEKFFKDPLIFDPDRFHPDAPKPYYCYYPFALGPRSCLGQNFAQMEAKVVMAKLLQRFDFTLVPGQSFDILDTATLRPKGGVLCSIRHRKHSQ